VPWVLASSTIAPIIAGVALYPLMIRFVVLSIWLWLAISIGVGMGWKISLPTGARVEVVWAVAVLFGGGIASIW